MKTTKPQLTLLVGPAGSGKTHFCTQAFEAALKESKNPLADDLLFILPTAEHRARTLDLVLRHGSGGFFQRRITTFDRALRELLRLGGFDFASDVTRRMILNGILSHLPLHYFSASAEGRMRPLAQKGGSASGGRNRAQTSGFLELVGRSIVEFKEHLIQPEELKKRLGGLKKQFPEFALKHDDLHRFYEAYDEELKKRNLIDQRDSLKLLEEGLTRGELKDPELKCVWIDGFSDFSKLQLAFIEFLARHADEVTVTLTLDQNPYRESLFEIVSETETALLDMGFRIKWLSEKNYRAENAALKHLEQNLFCHDPAKKGTGLKTCPLFEANIDDSIQIFEATGLQGELEMIAREIKRLVRTHPYHFSDIAVLFRATDPYISVIQSVFRKFQIPYELHERFRLRLSPIARTILSFFEILLNDWPRKDLFNFLKSVRTPSDGERLKGKGDLTSPLETASGIDDVSQLELQALEKGIYKDRAYWLESFPESKALRKIAHFEDQFLKLKTPSHFTEWLESVLRHFGLLEFGVGEVGTGSVAGQVFFRTDEAKPVPARTGTERTRMDRKAARRILLLLDELKGKMKNTQHIDPKEMAREFLALVEVDLFSVHSRDINRVQIYNVSVARQKEYKAVFLAGLLEKQFPIQIKEDPILSDLERQALNERGEILKERLPRQAFERYLFYLAATRARERLVLSFPRFDLEGKEALPSFYVEEVRILFGPEIPTKKQHMTEILPPFDEIANIEEAEEFVIQELWQKPDAVRGEGLNEGSDLTPPPRTASGLFALYNELIRNSDFNPFIQRLLESIEGVLEDAKIAAHFLPKQGMWSPTYLEGYAECPYRFFAHRGLHLESQAEGIDIRRRGTILHDVLEAFFSWQRDQNKSGKEISFKEAEDFCLKKFKELWEEEPLRGDRYYKIELERKKMQEMIFEILHAELIEQKPPIPGLIPAYFEYEFKDLILKGKRREIHLRGKIDRIDTDPSGRYALVIDYKTGKPFELRFLDNGVLLQLPFYLAAAREKLGLKPLGGHLYSLSKTKSSGFHHQDHLKEAGISTRKGNQFPAKDFEKRIERSVLFAERFVEEIEEAKIPVRPRDCVSYCPYSAVCRIEKWRLDHVYQEIAEEDRKWLKLLGTHYFEV